MLRPAAMALPAGGLAAKSLGQAALAFAGLRGMAVQAAPSVAAPTPNEVASFREDMRTFAQDFLAPHAAEIDRLNAYPPELQFWRKAGEWGLHGECMQRRTTASNLPPGPTCRRASRSTPAARCAAPRHHGAPGPGRAGAGLPAPRDCHGGNQPRIWVA